MRKILNIIFIVVTVALGIISWLFLPDEVIIQIGFDGVSTTSKIQAILFPFLISGFGIVVSFLKSDNENNKGYILSIVGILVLILELIFNIK